RRHTRSDRDWSSDVCSSDLVIKIMAREKSTRRLSPSVSVALSRTPSRRFHSESLAFSISSNSTKLSFILSVWYWFNTSWLSSGRSEERRVGKECRAGWWLED